MPNAPFTLTPPTDPLLHELRNRFEATRPNGSPSLEEIDLSSGRGLLVGAAGGTWASQVAGWASRVQTVEVAPGRLASDAVLVRPDGHVAWTGAAGPGELSTALRRWFGEPGEEASSAEGAGER